MTQCSATFALHKNNSYHHTMIKSFWEFSCGQVILKLSFQLAITMPGTNLIIFTPTAQNFKFE